MKAGKLMKLRITTVSPDMTVEQAHGWMLRLGIRHLPVLTEHTLAGIVSDRDLLLVISKSSDGQRFVYPPKTVGEVMTLSPRVAGVDVSISAIARLMVEEKLDAVPIVSKDNTLLGLLTSSDLLLLLTEMPEETLPAVAYEVRRIDTLPASA